MKKILELFKGFKLEYYLRHLFFGALIFGALIFLFSQGKDAFDGKSWFVVFGIINTILYPYARFTYEAIMDFIFGNNLFIVNALWLLAVKMFTMLMCWWFAIFITPVGLIFIYFYQKKLSKDNGS